MSCIKKVKAKIFLFIVRLTAWYMEFVFYWHILLWHSRLSMALVALMWSTLYLQRRQLLCIYK